MEYDHTLHDSIEVVAAQDWDRLWQGDTSPLTDRRFILAMERSMADCAKFRYLMLRDSDGVPVAAACLCVYRLDAALLLGGWQGRLARMVGRVFPRMLRLNLIFCGLPTAGQSFVRMAPHADAPAVLRVLDGQLCWLAKEERATCILWRDFPEEECRRLDGLVDLGYSKLPSLPMNHARPDYHSLDEYLAVVNSQKRWKFKRSRRRFAESDFRVVRMLGGEGAARKFSDDVYRLYEAVYEHSGQKLEKLSPAFFREVACCLPQESRFTFVYEGNRVVAFSLAVFDEAVYRVMSVGFDYETNRRVELYFNLMFETIDDAYRQGVSDIVVGQTSDDVKREKLNCYAKSRWFYIKGTRPLVSLWIRHRLPRWFPEASEAGPVPGDAAPGASSENVAS